VILLLPLQAVRIAKEQSLHCRKALALRTLPAERVLGEVSRAGRDDAPKPEGLHDGVANAQLVGGMQLAVRGDDRAQVVTERDVDGRAVVDRAHADLEKVLRCPAGRCGQHVGHLGRQLDGIDAAATGAEQPEEVGRLPHVDREVGIEHGRDED
jgi:hypothetical protein